MLKRFDCVVAEVLVIAEYRSSELQNVGSELAESERYYVLLEELKRNRVIRFDTDRLRPARWVPGKKLRKYFGAERHGLPDVSIDITVPKNRNAGSKYADHVRAYLSTDQQALLEHATTPFAFCRLGWIEYCGFDPQGNFFKAKPAFEERSREGMAASEHAMIVETIGDDGLPHFKFVEP
jgi:hypothetical protein